MQRISGLALLLLAVFPAEAADPQLPRVAGVRPLPGIGVDTGEKWQLVWGRQALFVFPSRQAAEEKFGKNLAAELVAGVDFNTEQAVIVRWSSLGPPFGELRWRRADSTPEPTVEFYVHQDSGSKGRVLRQGMGRFAVDRELVLRFAPQPLAQ